MSAETQSHEQPTPTQRKIGKYYVYHTLGEGGFSKVKLGVHETTRQKVALKLLKKRALTSDPASLRQVHREIAAMQRLSHDNVIRMLEVDPEASYTQRDGSSYDIILVVLELATGGELFDYLSLTGPFDEKIARTYCKQLLSALDHCHQQGIAHRDLKPENVLLDGNFNLKIADFGMSQIIQPHTSMQTVCGTPAYMAPELASGHGYSGPANDVWASGIILFIMVSGFPPFAKADVRLDWWFNKLATEKFSLFWQAHSRNVKYSDDFKEFCSRMLTVDPAKRGTVSELLGHAWLRGPTLSPDELRAELVRRKTLVDEHKNRTAMEAKVAAAGEAVRETEPTASSSLTAETVRGSGGATDDEESFAMGDELPELVPTFRYQSPALDVDAALEAEQEAQDFAESKVPAPLAAAAQGESKDGSSSDELVCYTRFPAKVAPAPALERAYRALQGFVDAQITLKREDYQIRAEVPTSDGQAVSFTVTVLQDPSQPGGAGSVVECRRMKGSSLSYNLIFLKLRTLLSDLIVAAAASSSPAPVAVMTSACSAAAVPMEDGPA